MRVPTTFGSLILSASLCAARACAPHPRPTTTSLASDTTTSGTVIESETNVESSVTISASTIEASTTAVGSVTTDLATTTTGLTSQETLTVTESETNVESSGTLSSSYEVSTALSSFTTKLATTSSGLTSEETLTTTELDTTAASSVTLSTFETSTTIDEATSTTIEATTTSAEPPAQPTNLVQNGGFEDSTIDPWVATGFTPSFDRFCTEGKQCLSLPGFFDGNTAKICQSVEVEQGFEYTFKVSVYQNCIASYGSNIVSCGDNVNKIDLSIDGVFDSGATGILGDGNYHEVSNTFEYVDPSIDSTDLCISLTVNEGVFYRYLLDGISLTRGKAVPIPEPTN